MPEDAYKVVQLTKSSVSFRKKEALLLTSPASSELKDSASASQASFNC